MKITPHLLAASVSLAVLAFGCNQAQEPVAAEEKPRMYEMSELASLMEQMYKDNQSIRERIMNGEIPASFPEDFKRIHTAAATDPKEINETYHAMADAYLQAVDAVTTSDSTTVKRAFNNLVQSCVSCHQIYCQGPIKRIQKLHIPE